MTAKSAMMQTDFLTMLTQALKLYRDGRTLELAAMPLADSALVAAEFLPDDTITLAARGRAVQAVLTWAIAELRPHGPEPGSSQTAGVQTLTPAWRIYKILHHFYVEHWTIERIAEELGFAPTSIFNLRTKAIAALADLLQSALASGALLAARQQATIAQRYQQLQPAAQTLVRIVAFFHNPIPMGLLTEIAPESTIDLVQESVSTIVQCSLAVYENREGTIYVPPTIRNYLVGQLRADERARWHHGAARYYEGQFNYLEAARHWRLAGASETAARLLLEQYHTINYRLKGNELNELLASFQSTEVAAPTWARLKLLCGQSAEARANFGNALAAYEEALYTDDVGIKAEAHYRLAKILEYRNLDEALVHYARGIELLEHTGVDTPLLVKMYIHRSWIFIQDRQDFRRAEASLQRAKRLIDPTNREDYADLYNASGELFHREEKWEYALEERLYAWLAAKESNDLARMVKIGCNLGRDYTELRRFAEALTYLEQSRTLAQENGMLDIAALCQEVIGVCYFYQADYAAAIRSYEAAYTLFEKVQNKTALTNVCFNLAEAYVMRGARTQAQHYYDEGLALAATLTQHPADSLRIVKHFAELKQKYPLLLTGADICNARQQQALYYVQQHEKITNREYRTLNRVQNKTAAEELKALVAQNLLEKCGQGANTFYRLPQPATPTTAAALPATLNQRQLQAIAYLQQHGQISNRVYRDLTKVGNKAAASDLRALVDQGLLTQVGKGPATVYRLVADLGR